MDSHHHLIARLVLGYLFPPRPRHNQEKTMEFDATTPPAALGHGVLYEGTKRLFSWPLTLGEYNAYRGWNMPPKEDAETMGYMVEYQDGGKANDPRHQGYISWSPADVFDRAYKRILQPYQQRVVDEKNQLDTKREGLALFLAGASLGVVPNAERERMSRQLLVMSEYSSILAERIAAF